MQTFQDEHIQTDPLLPKDSKWNQTGRDEEAGCCGGQEGLMPVGKDCENRYTKGIVY